MASPTSEPSYQPQQHPQQYPQQQAQHQGLPSISSLTNGLPLPSQQRSPDQHSLTDSTRDSGTWPQPNGQSKHNSANSGLHVSTLLNPDDSPPRNSVPSTPLSARAPTSAQSGGSQLPSINQGFTEPGNRDSHASVDSRRSSVDSRMQHGFGNLHLNNPTSPYESANTSQVSLAASLRRPNGGAPMSPLSGRASVRNHIPRVAPPIMPVGRAPGQPDPTAARPTQGYAWAFPDTGHSIPEERRGSESGDSSLGHGISRTNSLAASSIRSSIFSHDSTMPPGQRRFDDDQTTHHHSMQHRTVQSLQNENNAASAQAVGNYSRTPELRVSHKLAERKRRSEMKDLFEDLNKAVPANGGTKASKWEILTKAIDYIHSCQQSEQRLHSDLTRLQHEAEYARDSSQEIELLKREIEVMASRLQQVEPHNPHIYGSHTSRMSEQKQRHAQTNGSGINLPPLNPPGSSGGHAHGGGYQSGGPPPAAMQGVEYAYHGR